ncbi:DUF4249 family protein [Roseimarinus sediminis]|jgi:hypothetical protein|uniref:DUF4249 family protein n=1 Tax=Roseimarinus sediminis TaxID=1610899 RepID=UPI003D23C164
MKKKQLKYLLLMTSLTLLFQACETAFIPTLDERAPSLVVNGTISHEPAYVSLELRRAVPYNRNEEMEAEENAEVVLFDGSGKHWIMQEYKNGFYQTSELVEPVPGEAYWVSIITSDGLQYQSKPDTIPEPVAIRNIELRDSVHNMVLYDDAGQPYIDPVKGCYISAQPEHHPPGHGGYLYQWKALSNYFILSESMQTMYRYYCWDQIYTNSFYLYNKQEGRQTTLPTSDELYFMSYQFLSPHPLDSNRFAGVVSFVNTASFYFHMRQYTLTSTGQEYWESIMQQSEATGKLFDPVEARIKTNIRCISDSTVHAYGAFLAAPFHDQLLAVTLSENRLNKYYEIDIFPQTTTDENCLLEEKTPFWIEVQ